MAGRGAWILAFAGEAKAGDTGQVGRTQGRSTRYVFVQQDVGPVRVRSVAQRREGDELDIGEPSTRRWPDLENLSSVGRSTGLG